MSTSSSRLRTAFQTVALTRLGVPKEQQPPNRGSAGALIRSLQAKDGKALCPTGLTTLKWYLEQKELGYFELNPVDEQDRVHALLCA